MPAARKSTDAAKTATRKPVSPASTEAAASSTEAAASSTEATESVAPAGSPAPELDPAQTGDSTAGDSAAEESAEPAPMNRAERRAKGKGAQAPAYGKGKVVGGKGPAAGPRLWANRRSG